jgi:hypothetical protein
MLKENIINATVREFEYARVNGYSYRAMWSTPEVEHFLFFSTYGTPEAFLTADFGIKNSDAQTFGAKCVQVYGGKAYEHIGEDEKRQCYMRFPLGKLAGWDGRWSLNVSKMSNDELAMEMREAIGEKLFPIISDIVSRDQLFTLLLSDEEPVRWFHVNGAMRIAQIAYLATELHMGRIEIRSMLEPRVNELFIHLKGASLEPKLYIDRIIDDARTAKLAVQTRPIHLT